MSFLRWGAALALALVLAGCGEVGTARQEAGPEPDQAVAELEALNPAPDELLNRGSGFAFASLTERACAQDRYLVFHSANPLVPEDTNGFGDVYLRDLETGEVSRISLGMGGAEANGHSLSASISADGDLVAFSSTATNLVSGVGNGKWQVYVYQRSTQTMTAVTNGNNHSTIPMISADGSTVVFASRATNLLPGVGGAQVYHHVRGGATTVVSQTPAGQPGNGVSTEPACSQDGRYVAFASTGKNLVAGDTNKRQDVFLRDTQTGTTTRLSMGSAQGNNHSFLPSISLDGTRVAYSSYATNLTGTPTNGRMHVWVWEAGANTLISTDTAGTQGNNHSLQATLSPDGTQVAFASYATNFGGDTNGRVDLFTRTVADPATLVRILADGAEPDADSDMPGYGWSGTLLAFRSRSALFHWNDVNPSWQDVYVYNPATGDTIQANRYQSCPPYDLEFAFGLTTGDQDVTDPAPTRPMGVATGDFNGDGHLDAVQSNSNDNNLWLYRGNGDGTFQAPTVLTSGPKPTQVEAADLNNDSFLDILCLNEGDDSLSLFLNMGDGNFLPPSVSRTGSRPRSFSIGHLNGDSLPDVAVACEWEGQVEFFFNDPSFVLASTADSSVAMLDVVEVACGDFDGDGHVDVHTASLFMSTEVQLELLRGASDGTFVSSGAVSTLPVTVSAIRPAHLDHDRHLDLVLIATDRVLALLGLGNGLFSTVTLETDRGVDSPEALWVGDADCDGDNDLVWANKASQTLALAEGRGDGTFEEAFRLGSAAFPAGIALGDFDDDGRLDLASVNDTSGTLQVTLNQAEPELTQLLSLSSSGAKGDTESFDPSVSADGRYVAFASRASNLHAGDADTFADIFLRDRTTGTTELLSLSSSGAKSNRDSSLPSISADGRYIAFRSVADNLHVDDTDTVPDIYVRDRVTGTTELLSLNSSGVKSNNNSEEPSISADGRYVAFYSHATNLHSGDPDTLPDIFLRDRVTGTTELLSLSSSGAKGNKLSDQPSISADGRYVAFRSGADNLHVDDTDTVPDIFVRDRVTGTTKLISLSTFGDKGNFSSEKPSISADGRYVAFASYASNLQGGDPDTFSDIFVRDQVKGVTELISVSTNTNKSEPSISADGRYVAFRNFVFLVGHLIHIRDRVTNTTELVSRSTSGAQGNSGSEQPSISADGRYVAFRSFATNLHPGDTDSVADTFVRRVFKMTP